MEESVKGLCISKQQSDFNQTISDVYETFKHQGIMLIFNQFKFSHEGMNREAAAQVDEMNLCKTFQSIGYKVFVHNNLGREEILKTLERVSAENHSDKTSFIVAITTHGGDNKNLSTADKCITVDELWKPFTGDKCKTLSGKPKIFIIDACRGTRVDKGELPYLPSMESSEKYGNDQNNSIKIPVTADICIFFSSFDGFYSYENKKTGSWLINALCTQITQYSEIRIDDVLRNVQRAIAYEKTEKKQMPVVVSTLTKSLILRKRV